jgi:hypothetical protein
VCELLSACYKNKTKEGKGKNKVTGNKRRTRIREGGGEEDEEAE